MDSGTSAFRADDIEAALQHYTRVTEIAPDIGAGWFGVYMAAEALGDAEGAAAAYGACTGNCPGCDAPARGRQHTMTRWSVVVLVLAMWVAAGCAETEFQPPDRAERVSRAATAFSAAMFDSVAWGGDTDQLTAGNTLCMPKSADAATGRSGRGTPTMRCSET